jgi:hypothetical protein
LRYSFPQLKKQGFCHLDKKLSFSLIITAKAQSVHRNITPPLRHAKAAKLRATIGSKRGANFLRESVERKSKFTGQYPVPDCAKTDPCFQGKAPAILQSTIEFEIGFLNNNFWGCTALSLHTNYGIK